MDCCVATSAVDFAGAQGRAELDAAARGVAPGLAILHLNVPGMHCGACVAALERGLAATPGVQSARANLTARTLAIVFATQTTTGADLAARVAALGYANHPAEALEAADAAYARDTRALILRMGVAGFAAMNVMLLSVSVWSGAEGATRDLMHWVSALIAGPAVIYCGQPFFASAWAGLRAGRLNMDAPISLALLGALGISLSETFVHGPVAYYDAAVSLVFLLLVGRVLDRAMRARARSAASALARLQPGGARVVGADGPVWRPLAEIAPGDLVAIAPGERVAVDGVVQIGRSDIDLGAVTGESLPAPVGPGDALRAGAMNLSGALTVATTAVGRDSTLGLVQRLMAEAEARKSAMAQLADRAAAVYAPAIHLIAFGAMVWHLAHGADWRGAAMIAIATLIVTCPCALGIAAPMAQATAAGALFARGILLKDGGALERLALVRRAVFDKTGTLTLGAPRLRAAPPQLAAAAALAGQSRHPLARALAERAERDHLALPAASEVAEHPGQGIEGRIDGQTARLGRADWVGAPDVADPGATAVWFRLGAGAPVAFLFDDPLRGDAAATVRALTARGIACQILSGDRPGPVATVARTLGLTEWQAGVTPEQKIAHLRALGPGTLMVGDGLNDAPALAEASVSMAPASASDLGRAAADLVFMGDGLAPIAAAYDLAVRMRRVILQNFAVAALYNIAAIPIAVTGHVTPLGAALAMSSSSLIVVANALRLRAAAPRRHRAEPGTGVVPPTDRDAAPLGHAADLVPA